jgi:hypothetical protein
MNHLQSIVKDAVLHDYMESKYEEMMLSQQIMLGNQITSIQVG